MEFAWSCEHAITQELSKIAENTNGKLEGLKFKFKSNKSLKRKIDKNAKEKNLSLREADEQINDVLRYTLVRNENSFVTGYFDTVSALEKSGYRILKVKNA